MAFTPMVFLFILLPILLIIGLLIMIFCTRVKPVSETRIVMGTFVEITAYGKNAQSAIEAAFKRIHEIEAQVGRDKTSDISKLNADAGGTEIRVRNDTWQMMVIAKKYWKKTEKAFDVTVGTLVDLWGFGYDGTGRIPESHEIDAAMLNVGSDGLILEPVTHSVRLAKTGMTITVGGIAKGYAIEEAVAVLKAKGIKRAIVNGGGSSIKVIGSGRYSHLIDPRTGYPTACQNTQVSIITNNAAESEMLTKALFLNDREWSNRFLKHHAYQAIIVDTEGRVYTTKGLKLKGT